MHQGHNQLQGGWFLRVLNPKPQKAAHPAGLPEDAVAEDAVSTGRRGRKEPPTPLAMSRSTGGGGLGLWSAHNDLDQTLKGRNASSGGVCCVQCTRCYQVILSLHTGWIWELSLSFEATPRCPVTVLSLVIARHANDHGIKAVPECFVEVFSVLIARQAIK